MHLRSAIPQDAKMLTEIVIISKSYWGYSKEFIKQCEQDLTIDANYINESFVFVLENRNELIGFISFERLDYDYLDFFYVKSAQIGRGYGRLLWSQAIEKASEIGIKSFMIVSDPNAKGFYKKMGATYFGGVASTVFKDRNLPLMKYEIGPGDVK